MVKRILAGPWEALKERFPDRQIYHRTEGQVRYFVVRTEMQVGAIAAACLVAMWVAIATVNMVVNTADDRGDKARLAALEARYQEMLEEARAAEAAAIAYLESRTDQFDRTAGEFQMRHETLRRLMDFAEDLQIGGGNESPSLGGGEILMAATTADPDPRTALVSLDHRAGGEAGAEGRVQQLVEEQDALLAEAEDSAEARLENLRAVLRLTGLRLDDVIEHESPDGGGTGGPFIPLEDSQLFGTSLDLENPFNARVSRIAARLVEAESLSEAVTALPLGEPVGDGFRETSDYGTRIDPFTRRAAFHAGKDFAAYRNAPIVAASPGRIVYAGWRAGYGRTVEVDHGYGFKTRYGHLNSIDVRRGDEVTAGQRIGGMGSTGRSTATHLHYEIWYQGDHLDPERFLRAGRYVQ
ncbi:peptidase M24 [Marinicauda pacifica]|uniref:M23 family metallopeptidase n=1 Tax=Marinicauda pacifica TaxID=1133559 RepID=A0A4S2HEE7_9PROT|nr:M23 family metallopeptidase [Marinicauda pacifica]TGY94386.1 M23 family metallopeptidase [Marinicauda pacifica]GGE35380.1 peptidase M24 [Marinicauda pacifica]